MVNDALLQGRVCGTQRESSGGIGAYNFTVRNAKTLSCRCPIGVNMYG